jgi:hypothetical protein
MFFIAKPSLSPDLSEPYDTTFFTFSLAAFTHRTSLSQGLGEGESHEEGRGQIQEPPLVEKR